MASITLRPTLSLAARRSWGVQLIIISVMKVTSWPAAVSQNSPSTPMGPMSIPPSAGAAIRGHAIDTESRATALPSLWSSTTLPIIAWSPARPKDWMVPLATAVMMKYHHSKNPREMSSATAAQRMTNSPSVQSSSVLRSTLSATTPPTRGMNSMGQERAETAMPMRRGEPVASNTQMARANTRMERPELEVMRPAKSSR